MLEQLEKNGVTLIEDERRRQIVAKGFTTTHDQEHIQNELAFGAICYAHPERRYVLKRDANPSPWPLVHLSDGPDGAGDYMVMPPSFWPFEPQAWKPTLGDRLRDLTKAGAMIAAEIDRLRAVQMKNLRIIAKHVPAERLEPYDPKKMQPGVFAVTADRRPAWMDITLNGKVYLYVDMGTAMVSLSYDAYGKPVVIQDEHRLLTKNGELLDDAKAKDLRITGIIPEEHLNKIV